VSAEHIVSRSKELLVLRFSSWVVQVRASVSAEHLTPHTVPKLEREPLWGSWCKSEVYRTGTQSGLRLKMVVCKVTCRPAVRLLSTVEQPALTTRCV